MQTEMRDGKSTEDIVLDGREVCIVDDDELVRTDDGWRIKARKYTMVRVVGF